MGLAQDGLMIPRLLQASSLQAVATWEGNQSCIAEAVAHSRVTNHC